MAACSSSGGEAAMTMNRLLPLACAAWLVALVVATPRAQTAAGPDAAVKADPKKVHVNLSLFTTSENCIACHNALMTPTGEDVSIGASWRSTMMANSARDPYWQAGVRRETTDFPMHAATIQDECAA